MLEVNVTVKCPDLLLAATAIAAAFKPSTQVSAPVEAAPAAPVAAPMAPVSAPTAAQPVAPAVAPVAAPVAPTAPAPGFTLAQVSKTGADLIAADPGKMQALLGLLQQFNVPAISELPTDQLGTFATALRGLGAKI